MILEVHCMPADITRATVWNGGVPQGTTWKELILRGQLLGVSQTIRDAYAGSLPSHYTRGPPEPGWHFWRGLKNTSIIGLVPGQSKPDPALPLLPPSVPSGWPQPPILEHKESDLPTLLQGPEPALAITLG